jgi:hypothetical protein
MISDRPQTESPGYRHLSAKNDFLPVLLYIERLFAQFADFVFHLDDKVDDLELIGL